MTMELTAGTTGLVRGWDIVSNRGELNANKDGITGTPRNEEDWTLDPTGNWTGYVQKLAGTTLLDQSRTHNAANELTAASSWATSVEDRVGNMTTVPKPSSLADGLTLKYDAWNRLVQVTDDETVVAKYEYDGTGRRTKKHIDSASPDDPDGIDRYEHHFYVGQQLVETRNTETESAQSESLYPHYQWIWSPRYIDAPILRNQYISGTLQSNARMYFLNDANMNVTTLMVYTTTGESGSPLAWRIVERLVYDAYGRTTFYNGSWNARLMPTYYDNSILYTGRYLDLETNLYHYRARYYQAELGRFVSRDPVQADLNLYRYCTNNPVIYVDPLGLWTSDTHRQLTREAFLAAFPDYAEVPGDACAAYLLDIMTQSNVAQDNGSMPWSGADQPGQQNYRHYCRDQNQTAAQADAAYTQYLNTETNTFNSALAGSRCLAALQALGRLTHSWQDYYGHAVTLVGNANAWGTGINTGNPDAPGSGVKAPTFYYNWVGYPAGEHGLSEPGDRDANSALRRSEAIDFVAAKIKNMLNKWLANEKCKCNCPPEGSNYVTI